MSAPDRTRMFVKAQCITADAKRNFYLNQSRTWQSGKPRRLRNAVRQLCKTLRRSNGVLAVRAWERRGKGVIDHRGPFGPFHKLVQMVRFSGPTTDFDLSTRRENTLTGQDQKFRLSESSFEALSCRVLSIARPLPRKKSERSLHLHTCIRLPDSIVKAVVEFFVA